MPVDGDAVGPDRTAGAAEDISGLDARRSKMQGLILIAEDNEDNITTFADFLVAKGFNVTVARSGMETVVEAKLKKPDAIIMDIQMPGLNGLEATRLKREDAELDNAAIIAITALAMPGDRERCLSAGADEYLSKPVRMTELVSRIDCNIRKRKRNST